MPARALIDRVVERDARERPAPELEGRNQRIDLMQLVSAITLQFNGREDASSGAHTCTLSGAPLMESSKRREEFVNVTGDEGR